MPTQAIKEAVLSCDDLILGEQHLRQMEAFAPDKKEVRIQWVSSLVGVANTTTDFHSVWGLLVTMTTRPF